MKKTTYEITLISFVEHVINTLFFRKFPRGYWQN